MLVLFSKIVLIGNREYFKGGFYMKTKIFMGSVGLLLATTIAMSEQVTATSETFSFPSVTGVGHYVQQANMPYFKFAPVGRTAAISWSVPANVEAKSGSLRIYSLLGKEVASYNLTSKTGSINWNTAKSKVPTGVYIARLAYGSFKSNLKLVFYK
jgi:FlaG/FlaF family flagellin (archaellin)